MATKLKSLRMLLALSALTAKTAAWSAPLPLVPWPSEVTPMSGTSALGADTLVTGELRTPAAATLRDALRVHPGGKGTAISLRIDGHAVPAAEAYDLQVTPLAIDIVAHDRAGLFYGVQTLLQLLPPACADGCRIPAVHVRDAPRFAWRGLLVDLSRHYFDQRVLMSVIDEMAAHKLNRLHLHLTDDTGWRFEVPTLPALTTIGAAGDADSPGQGAASFLDAKSVAMLEDYAAARYIEIVPEVEMPAHAGAAARALPQLATRSGVLVPGRAQTMRFVRDVFAAAAAQFPSPVLHFGGDEVGAGAWAGVPEVDALMASEGLRTQREVEGRFDDAVAGAITALGRRPMAWDEAAEAGVGPGVIIQWWRKDRPDVLAAAVDSGHDVVLSPVDRAYFDYHSGEGEPGAPWEGNDGGPTSVAKVLAWEPVPAQFTATQARHVLGIEAALWTEFIRSERYLQFMLYPRLFAFSEVAWSARARPGLDDFDSRIGPHLDRLAARGIRFRRNADDAAEFLIH